MHPIILSSDKLEDKTGRVLSLPAGRIGAHGGAFRSVFPTKRCRGLRAGFRGRGLRDGGVVEPGCRRFGRLLRERDRPGSPGFRGCGASGARPRWAPHRLEGREEDLREGPVRGSPPFRGGSSPCGGGAGGGTPHRLGRGDPGLSGPARLVPREVERPDPHRVSADAPPHESSRDAPPSPRAGLPGLGLRGGGAQRSPHPLAHQEPSGKGRAGPPQPPVSPHPPPQGGTCSTRGRPGRGPPPRRRRKTRPGGRNLPPGGRSFWAL